MKTIQKLNYKINTEATMGRDLILYIDKKPLLKLLENTMPKNEQPWKEKKEAKVVVKNLKTSVEKEGNYELLTCSHCNISRDILMETFTITFEEDYILWTLYPPSLYPKKESQEALVFTFHKPQYEKVIQEILEHLKQGSSTRLRP